MAKICTDLFFILGIFLNASLFIPQIILLYRTKKADNISLPMFLGFNMIQLSTIIHGYMVTDYILMWGYVLSLVSCGIVTLLILHYRYIKNDASL